MVKNNDEIEIFMHREGRAVEVLRLSKDSTVEDAMSRSGIDLVAQDLYVFSGEVDQLLDEDEQAETTSLAPNARAGHGQAGITHLHCHTCRSVRITVNYQSGTKSRSAPPTTTVAAVLAWARQVFSVSGQDGQSVELHLCEDQEALDESRHIGELTRPGSCELCFNLCMKPRIQGAA